MLSSVITSDFRFRGEITSDFRLTDLKLLVKLEKSKSDSQNKGRPLAAVRQGQAAENLGDKNQNKLLMKLLAILDLVLKLLVI